MAQPKKLAVKPTAQELVQRRGEQGLAANFELTDALPPKKNWRNFYPAQLCVLCAGLSNAGNSAGLQKKKIEKHIFNRAQTDLCVRLKY
jgi:hypothetical protein